MIRKNLFLFAIGYLGSLNVFSQTQSDQNTFSLQQAQDYAMNHNAIVKNATLDIGKAKGRVQELTRIGFPQVSSEAKYQNFIDIPTSIIPETAFNPSGSPDVFFPVQFGTNNTAIASVTATQLIFDGSYIVGLQAARKYLEFTRELTKKVELDIREKVESAYFVVLIAEENRDILSATVENAQQIVEEAKTMYELGFIEEVELEQMELSLSQIQAAKIRAITQIKSSYNLLKLQMGFPMEDTLKISESLEQITDIAMHSAGVDSKLVLDNHIDYNMASLQEDLLHLNHRLTKSQRLPTIGAFMSHSQNAFSNEVDFSTWYPTTLWGISMQLPIFNSFMQTAREKQTFLDWQKAVNTKWQTSQSLIMQADNAMAAYSISVIQSKTQLRNMELAEKILTKTIIKQKEGLATSMETTMATNQLLEAQGQYIQALFDLLSSRSKLKKALNNYQ